jgi:hypothetical protein
VGLGGLGRCVPAAVVRSLHAPIAARHRAASAALLSVFLGPLRLVEHLAALRAVMCASEPRLLAAFTADLFARVGRGSGEWAADEAALTEALRTSFALGGGAPALPLHKFRVEVRAPRAAGAEPPSGPGAAAVPPALDAATGRPARACRALAPLRIAFDVRWPLDAFVGAREIARYNDIFGLVLEVRRVRCRLEARRLRTLRAARARMQGDPRAATLTLSGGRRAVDAAEEGREDRPAAPGAGADAHFLLTFLAEALHVVRVLEVWIADRVVLGRWGELRARVRLARTVADVREAHSRYLDTMWSECLLGPGSASLLQTVRSALDKALALESQSERHEQARRAGGAGRASAAKAAEGARSLALSFRSSVRFLLLLIHRKTAGGSEAHLVSLMDAIDHNGFYAALEERSGQQAF